MGRLWENTVERVLKSAGKVLNQCPGLITTMAFHGHEKHKSSQKLMLQGLNLFVTSCVYCG